MRLIGARQLEQELTALGTKDAKKAVRAGTRKGLKIIQRSAQGTVPVDTGRLKNAIKIARTRKQPTEGLRMMLWIRPGARRADSSGAWYGAFVERGHKQGPHRFITGRYFFQRAVDSSQEQAAQAVSDEIATQIDKTLAKRIVQ